MMLSIMLVSKEKKFSLKEKRNYSLEMDDNEKNMNEMQDLNYKNMNEMSSQQVRWKMNALTKRYKECIDSNNKTGRGAVEFQWFDQLDEIFGKNNVKSAYLFQRSCLSFLRRHLRIKNITQQSLTNRVKIKERKKRSCMNLILK
ncbi:uncharacterized protein LOC105430010 [Pogonomyrmex barbatus]|uniref:Uncharacterized protein LOC105430010 n=1 Tax=Pogonomyrmex barbatus TaxID=144034 RepID=A0A6I9XA79_9HYME|nr:uncharacterized protein LOC105430010 [Pogonomyrmex barbatus]